MTDSTKQDPSHMEALRGISARLDVVDNRLAVLRQTNADGSEYEVPLAAAWQRLPGRPGVHVYHVPHPTAPAHTLWLGVFYVEPHSEYTGSHIAETRLVTILEGELECNGLTYRPGDVLRIGSHESTSWKVRAGACGVTLYSAATAPADE